jgi:L-threonylcarbamoyladenylate synthase
MNSSDTNTNEIAKAAALIRAGKTVAFPTETVYGLGADAFNALAVARIFEIKGRPSFDPLIVHLADIAHLEGVASGVPLLAHKLAEKFWPGPLTLVLPKTAAVPDIVTSGLNTVGVRVPDHALARALIEAAGTPVAAPSANLFGRISPTTAQHVRDQLGASVDLILDGGPCRVGVESTIVSFAEARPLVLRLGGVTVEEIEAAIGRVDVFAGSSERPAAPGNLPSHYAPRTPLTLVGADNPVADGEKIGYLAFQSAPKEKFGAVEVLSPRGDLREAAANLYGAMRRLDALGFDAILAETAPESGLGRAINDRLRRAAAKCD